MSEKKFPKLSLWREDVERCISDAEACIDACDGHAEDDMSSLFLNVISLEEHAHLLAEKKCERCSHLFYAPETIIKCEKQRAAEWEDVAKKFEAENKRLREALEEIAEYKEFRPEMMQFRRKNGEFENFGRFAREALMWQDARTKNRENRGVEGTSKI